MIRSPRARARHLAYLRWYAMIKRCTDPGNPDYRWYGARGIQVCDEWTQSFDAFYRAVGDPPGPGLTMDRIDVDRGYEPGNMRWATRLEQVHNRRVATHCSAGHAYTPENTYLWGKDRHCRACHRVSAKAYRERVA